MEYLARMVLEHQGINELLQVQRELLERLKKAKGVNIVHLNNSLAFWRDFLEQEHMSWEEEFAFAAFRKFNHSLPDRLQGEHERIRTALAQLEATLKQLKSGRPRSGREYVKWGEELVETVADHIARENAVLRELAVDGPATEAVLDLPEGPRRERINHLVQIAEELCREYLQKGTALYPLCKKTGAVVGQTPPPATAGDGDETAREGELGEAAGSAGDEQGGEFIVNGG
ncbi:MAG: hypothetical protein GX081_05335 [Firmicutes bacterium]|nr:hypothetical protein [Bacillota bacterium]